ncbi:hypothetical protein [Streptomyces sp. NBC_00645]|uniref:hypothetical protein n=1 Tax=Streptomyces sp. NBC_00645 TaxID=2975795 RepID=UPI00324B835D
MAAPTPLRLKVAIDWSEPDELMPRLCSRILDVVKDTGTWFRYALDPNELAETVAHAVAAELLTVRPSTPAEVELAALHEGEEPYTDPAVEPTPAQLLYQWSHATPEQRLDWAARSLSNAAGAASCFQGNHEGQLALLRAAREQRAAADAVQQAWFEAASRRLEGGRNTEPRHLAELSLQLSTALGRRDLTPPARCSEHDGVCFPQPVVVCKAHGHMQCLLCHLNPADCADSTGSCSTWAATGMHHDSCWNRSRTPLATDQPADEATAATEELVHSTAEQQVSEPQPVDDPGMALSGGHFWPLADGTGLHTGWITTDVPMSLAAEEAVRAAGIAVGTHLTREMVDDAIRRKAAADATVRDAWRQQLDGSWTTDAAGGTLTVPVDITPERREAFLRAYARALEDSQITPEQARADAGMPGTP